MEWIHKIQMPSKMQPKMPSEKCLIPFCRNWIFESNMNNVMWIIYVVYVLLYELHDTYLQRGVHLCPIQCHRQPTSESIKSEIEIEISHETSFAWWKFNLNSWEFVRLSAVGEVFDYLSIIYIMKFICHQSLSFSFWIDGSI